MGAARPSPGAELDADAVESAIDLLDRGEVRAAEPDGDGGWRVNAWAKQAVLLYFRVRGLTTTQAGPFEYHDKLPLKSGYEALGVRVVPPATARYGAHLEPGVVLMPSYVNIGAWVGAGTMVDTWATVGSCAQIGAGVHLAGGVGVGGVLEPVQAAPVVIEDGAFIGSRCIVVEGVRVGRGAVLGAGVVLTGNTPVIDVTGAEAAEHRGSVPERAIVIPGNRSRVVPGRRLRPALWPDHRLPDGCHRRQGPAERAPARLRFLDGLSTAVSDRRPPAPRPDDRSSSRPSPPPGGRSGTRRRSWWASVRGSGEEDLDELAALADSAGAETVGRVVQSRREPDPQYWIGKGKVEELHGMLRAAGAELVILDEELTPGHLRSLEARLKVKVIDRTALILDIFALHARTREGKAQVELAQLNYLLPRLRGWGEALSRLGRRHRHPVRRRRDEARDRPPAHPPPHHEVEARPQGSVEDPRRETGAADGQRRAAGGDRRATRTPGSPR